MTDAIFPDPAGIETDPVVREKLERFRDMKFGLMLHWGPYSVWGAVESWPICDAEPYGRERLPAWEQSGKDVAKFMEAYFALNQQFNPTHFEPEEWAEMATDAGMKYLVFTTKHHDGFCMFDTRQTDYRITHPSCPFHHSAEANVARVLFDAFRRRDFKIGVYLSKADWHHRDYWNPDHPRLTREASYDATEHPVAWARYVDFVHNQVEELMTGYGPVEILWLDSDWVRPPREDIDMPRLAAMARKHQPGLIIVDRAVGGRYENYRTPEQTVPETFLEGIWESCITMGEQWSFNPTDQYKSARDLIHMLIRIVARGGNLLLNVGPGPDGCFPPKARQRLSEIGHWLRINGEAIYGTRPIEPYEHDNVVLTERNDTLYLIFLARDGDDAPPLRTSVPIVEGAETVRLLGADEPVAWTIAQAGLTISVPQRIRQLPPCRDAWAFALTGATVRDMKNTK